MIICDILSMWLDNHIKHVNNKEPFIKNILYSFHMGNRVVSPYVLG